MTDEGTKDTKATNCIKEESKALQGANKALENELPIKKKKTFEIDEELDQYLKAEAIRKGLTINELVNKSLWKAISEDTKDFIG